MGTTFCEQKLLSIQEEETIEHEVKRKVKHGAIILYEQHKHTRHVSLSPSIPHTTRIVCFGYHFKLRGQQFVTLFGIHTSKRYLFIFIYTARCI